MDNIKKDTSLRAVIWFYKYILSNESHYPGRFFILCACVFMIVAYGCALPLILKIGFDDALIGKNLHLLFDIFILALVLFTLALLANYLLSRINSILGTQIIDHLRLRIYKKTQDLDMNLLSDMERGSIITTFSNDIGQVEYAAIHITWTMIRVFLLAMVSTILLFYYYWKLTAVMFLIIGITTVINKYFSKPTSKISTNKKNNEAELLMLVDEAIIMNDTVKLLNIKNFKRLLFKNTIKQANKDNAFYNYKINFGGRKSTLIGNFLGLIIFFIGIYAIILGNITVGGFMAFFSLIGNIKTAASEFANLFPALVQGAKSMDRIQAFIKRPLENPKNKFFVPSAFTDISQNIIGKNAGLTINNHPVISNFTFEIKPKQSVAFVGPSGSGKSTLLRLLLGYYSPSEGEIFYGNTNIKNIAKPFLYKNVAFVSQNPKLFADTIKQNIRAGKLNATDDEIIAAAKMAEIHEDILKLPEGYETHIKRDSTILSGGQCQRIIIARAIIANPKILFLDEATSALDPINSAAIDEIFAKISDTSTVISATHRLQSVKHMDKIYVVDKGNIVESGSHEELLKSNRLYHKLWEKQDGITLSADKLHADVDPEWLRNIPLFANLNMHTLVSISKLLTLERFDMNRVIFEENDFGNKLYIIVAGMVEISRKLANGQRKVLANLIDGDFFGEIALLREKPRNARATTKGVCIFLTLDHENFIKLFKRLPSETQEQLNAVVDKRSLLDA